MRSVSRRHQDRVNAVRSGVKGLSADLGWANSARTLSSGRSPEGWPVKERVMADVAYLALILGVFGVLALMLRGLEKLR